MKAPHNHAKTHAADAFVLPGGSEGEGDCHLRAINVAVLVYPGVEMVDMNGPVDVFLKASTYGGKSKYNVFTVAETGATIPCESAVVSLTPNFTIASHPEPDIIVIPGQITPENSPQGFGDGLEKLVAWIKAYGENFDITVMSVCIGAYILAATGLLTGKRATTHYLSIADIQKMYPQTKFVKNVRYVHDGNIVTTGGITSGIDGALHLVELRDGLDVAQHVADIMVYNREAPLPPFTLLPPYQ